MEATQIGFRDGLEAAKARLDGGLYHEPLTWNVVRRQLLDYEPDPILDQA